MSEVKNMPQLRFTEFSGEWEEKNLGSVGQIVTGKTPSTSNPELWDGDISFITPTDITEQGKYQAKTQRTITKQRNTKLLPIGSISYTCIASIGKMTITTNNSSTNQQINSIIVNDDFNNEYVYYALLKLTPYIKSTQANTTLPIINKTEFSGFKIQIPSLQEQVKIAAFLTSVDNKIELLRQKQELLGEYKKGVMQQIFSQVIRFKADDGSDFPEWEEKNLGSVGQIVTGKTPSTSNPELWDGDISFITPTDITEQGKYQAKTQRTITKQRNTKLLPIGSISYTCIASIGKMTITTNNSSTNQQINSIIVNDDFNNEYVYYALLKLTPYIKSTQANTTLPIINKTEFSGFKIQIPSLQEQVKIANFLSLIDNKIDQVGKQLIESKQFKKALLQQMFV